MTTDTTMRGVVEVLDTRLLERLRVNADIHTVTVEENNGALAVTIGYSYEDNGYGFALEELRAVTGGPDGVFEVKVVAV